MRGAMSKGGEEHDVEGRDLLPATWRIARLRSGLVLANAILVLFPSYLVMALLVSRLGSPFAEMFLGGVVMYVGCLVPLGMIAAVPHALRLGNPGSAFDLVGIALAGSGIATGVFGVAFVSAGAVLAGVAAIAAGLGSMLVGKVIDRSPALRERLNDWIARGIVERRLRRLEGSR